jgi:hypothetical protein
MRISGFPPSLAPSIQKPGEGVRWAVCARVWKPRGAHQFVIRLADSMLIAAMQTDEEGMSIPVV